jgi:hypothetical protein
MKFGIYSISPEHISTVYFMNPSHLSVCLCAYPPIVARIRFDKMLPQQQTQNKNCWRRRFLCGSCRIKEKQTINSSHNFLFQIKKSRLKINVGV